MNDICEDEYACDSFKPGGYYNTNKDQIDTLDKEKFLYCKKECSKIEKDNEIIRQTDIDDEFGILSSDLSKRQIEMSTTDQFVKDTTQLWRFEKNKLIFLIICLILISLCAFYMVYKNTQ